MPKTPTGASHRLESAGGNPAVVPAHNEQHVALGSPARILDWLKRNPLPASSRRSAEEIDADIDAERNSWD